MAPPESWRVQLWHSEELAMPDVGQDRQDLLPISGTLRRKRAEARLARAAYGTNGWRLIEPDDDGEWVVGEATGRLCLPVLIDASLSTAAALGRRRSNWGDRGD